jgi:ankyrin repeat protein
MISELKKLLGIDSIEILKNWINYQNKFGETALHYASKKGNIEIINILIENGGDVEIINHRGKNMLHFAAEGNQPVSLVYFKEKHSLNIHSFDEKGSSLLHWACYWQAEQSVEFILSWSIDIDIVDKEGITALHLAVEKGKLKKFFSKFVYGVFILFRKYSDNKDATYFRCK